MTKINNFYTQKKILEYLFLFIPVFLISGPFLSDLSLSLIAILFLIFVFKKKKYHLFKKKFFYYFIFFYFYLVFNSLFQNINFDSLKISLSYLRFGIFSLAIIYIINSSEKILFKLFLIYQIIFCLLILDGFFQYFNGYNILGFKLSTGPRVSSFFGDELVLGGYLSRSFPVYFALYLYFFEDLTKFYRYIGIILFVLIEILIFLSGERSAFFFFNLFAVFVLFFTKRLKNFRGIFTVGAVLILIIISNAFSNSTQRIFHMTLDQMNITNEKKFVFFSRQHNELYNTAIRITKDNLITGVGIKNFRKFCSDPKYSRSPESCSTHPHNTYIQLLVELGLTGFAFGLFVLFFLFKVLFVHYFNNFFNKKPFDDFQISLLGGMLIILWPFSPSGNIFNNWLNIIYFYPFSILMWSFYKKKADK